MSRNGRYIEVECWCLEFVMGIWWVPDFRLRIEEGRFCLPKVDCNSLA